MMMLRRQVEGETLKIVVQVASLSPLMLAPTPFNGDDDEEDDDDDDDDDEDDYGGGIMTLILMCKWEANLCRYPYCGSSCKFISTDAGTHTFQW